MTFLFVQVAQRLMGKNGVFPTSYPTLPFLGRHPLWTVFDAILEQGEETFGNSRNFNC